MMGLFKLLGTACGRPLHKLMKAPLIILLISSVHASGELSGYGFSSFGPRELIDIDAYEHTKEASDYSPNLMTGLASLSDRKGAASSDNAVSLFVDTPTNTLKRKSSADIDLVSDATEGDEALAKKGETGEALGHLLVQEAKAAAAQEEDMDVQTLSIVMSVFSEEKLLAKFTALGDGVRASLKEHCNWNLLHEAVYTDNLTAARVLLRDFGFNPNEFDPYFGSAMYLVQSRVMAELLKEYRGNLLDRRPCLMYQSAIDSSRVRRKLAIISMVEMFETRYGNMLTYIRAIQVLTTEIKFEAKRDNMFAVAAGIISRRRAGFAKAEVFVIFKDEEGIDAGGLTREFIQMIKDQILNAKRVVTSDENGRIRLIPDPEPGTLTPAQITEHDNELRLFGYIVGLSVYHKVPLKIEFQPIIYYVLSGLNPNRDVTDWIGILKETDRTIWKSLLYVAEFPKGYTFPEIKGDSNRPWKLVRTEIKNDKDIKEFLTISAKNSVYLKYEQALNTFKSGFDLAIQSNIISEFVTPNELKDTMIGETDYTAEQWKSACQAPTHLPMYKEMYTWFWEIIDELTRDQRAELLKYVTALVSLPYGGFQALDKQPSVLIIDEIDKIDYLPRAATCFNQIRFYPASSKEEMKEALIKAFTFGADSFGDR